jgi:hypothetical protein
MTSVLKKVTPEEAQVDKAYGETPFNLPLLHISCSPPKKPPLFFKQVL